MTHRTFAGVTVVETFYGDSDVIAAGHVEALRFPTPVCPDDTLAVELERRNEAVWAR